MDFKNDNLWLMHGDCLERMKEIESGSVDMILADCPYGTTACKWDSIIPLEPMWEQLKRIIKPNGAIVMTASQPFTSILGASNIEWLKYSWIWEKSKASNFPHAPNMPLKIFEDILVFSRGIVGHKSQAGDKRITYNPQGVTEGTTVVKQNKNTSELKYHRESQTNHTTGYTLKGENYPKNILKIKSEYGFHPTQKPVALMEYLIKTYTNENETVLDFTAGSFTTGVACVNLNRKFIGIELDDHYFEIGVNRVLKAQES